MLATDVLAMQLQGSCRLIAEQSHSAAPHWAERAFAGASLPGFVVWHCGRVLDWAVNAVVRGEPEVATADRWRDRIGYHRGHGAGLTLPEADSAATAVSPDDVVAYAGALLACIDGWLPTIEDASLDREVDVRAACATNPLYQTPAAWAEVENLDRRPAWQILAQPCAGHIRVHMGELDVLLALLTARSGGG
ncbi:MAG TPA: hypothetical protein VF155_00165 [Candidatus Dormibacteraeota bacterium]